MKPILASEVLRQTSTRQLFTSNLGRNRFHLLRDQSLESGRSLSSVRNRSVSTKRKSMDSKDLSYAQVAAGNSDAFREKVSAVETGIARVRSISDKLTVTLSSKEIDGIFFSVLTDIHGAICDLSANQSTILELITTSASQVIKKNQNRRSDEGHLSKKVRKDLPQKNPGLSSQPESGENWDMEDDDEEVTALDADIRTFRTAVKEAERSSLVFNLNMGKSPIMNTDTMQQRATKALTDMAAANEGNRLSEETVSSMDDVLSMVKKVSFFGKTTKTYRHPTDKMSGAYCTIPVKYDFKDKDTRVRAEMRLRDTCKVMCSTPYHPTLRESIKQVVQHFKKDYPLSLIRVNVDTKNMCFRVSRKAKGELDWMKWDLTIPIPDIALDTKTKKVPPDFKVLIPQKAKDPEPLSLSPLGGRLSRRDSPPKKTPSSVSGT